jgi:hypothetical protein
MTEIPLYPPLEWFTPPPTMPKDAGCIVEPDGRIYGYLAHWGSVLMDGTNDRWKAPRSKNGYAFAHTGDTQLDDGTVLKTANLGGDFGHAPTGEGSLSATQDFYENTQTQLARIRYGEDEHGVWFAGSCWPNISEFDIAKLRASARSGHWAAVGDWRDLSSGRSGYELVGACLVNVPGLKYARADKAASGVLSLTPFAKFSTIPAATDVVLHPDRALEWDADEAEQRVRAWASGDGSGNVEMIDWDAYGSLHFWYDPDNARDFSGYKMVFADIFEQEPRAVYAGVLTATDGLAEDSVIPLSDFNDVTARISGYLDRFATETTPAVERVASMGTVALATISPVAVGGILLVEGSPTEDGRLIEEGATEWRDGSLPIYSSLKNLPGHDSADLVGRIDKVWRDEDDPKTIRYSGVIDPAAANGAGQQTLDAIEGELLTGISIDGIVGPNDSYIDDDETSVMSKIVIAGATLTPMPAIREATVTLLKSSTKEFAMPDELAVDDAVAEEAAVDETVVEDDQGAALADQVAAIADRQEYLIGLVEGWQMSSRLEAATAKIAAVELKANA